MDHVLLHNLLNRSQSLQLKNCVANMNSGFRSVLRTDSNDNKKANYVKTAQIYLTRIWEHLTADSSLADVKLCVLGDCRLE